MPDVESIMLGSGKLFIAELDSSGGMPETLFSDENCVGDIQGGATLEYKPEIKEVKNDFSETRKVFIKSEDATLKSGVLTWDMPTLEKLTVGASYDTLKKELTLGGKKTIKQYAIGFEHTEDIHIKLSMIGYNQSGLTIKFDPENETVIDAEFKAKKDDGGVLIKIAEVTA